jgi:hypothetical protein
MNTTITDPKLIPFNIDIALRQPERLRHIRGYQATKITHFPAAIVYPVAIHWKDDLSPCFYTLDGRSMTTDHEPVVFLTAETKLVPWTSINEVPEGVYFRLKGEAQYFIATGYSSFGAGAVRINGAWRRFIELVEAYEYSPNRNGPWLPCGKEENT